jgi:ribosomal RNA-processing protein 12
MLPLLKENIERTELAYFVDKLLPLARKLKEKSNLFKKNKKMIESKVFDNLQNQIWSFLPGFCDFCTDFKQTFPPIATSLGQTLEKSPDLRYHILHAFKNLINRNTGKFLLFNLEILKSLFF